MKWTKTKPIKPGIYWMKVPNGDREVVRVMRYDIDDDLRVLSHGNSYWQWMDEIDETIQWGDPIEEPTDETN